MQQNLCGELAPSSSGGDGANMPRVDYGPQTLILRFPATPTSAHNVLQDFRNKSINYFARRNMITEEE